MIRKYQHCTLVLKRCL